MPELLISVVIAPGENEKELIQTLRSVEEQNHPSIELILLDRNPGKPMAGLTGNTQSLTKYLHLLLEPS